MSANDPVGSEKPRGKDTSQRKHRNDGTSWTPTERTIKDRLMKQFTHLGEGACGQSEAFRESPLWCSKCGMRPKTGSGETGLCAKCEAA